MVADVDIVNLALIELNEEPITSLSEDSEVARAAKLIYSYTRNNLLRDHDWNFAIERVQLAPDITPPEFEFSNRFALPVNYLRALELYPKKTVYKIEGKYILANADSICLKFIEIKPEDDWDFSFSLAMKHQLAADLAYRVTNNTSLKQQQLSIANSIIDDAKRNNFDEDVPDEPLEGNWLEVRR